MSLTFTDIFCGAGGSSIGLEAAGFELKLAANHWARAIETHAANFRDADHLCADVNNYDMRRLPKTDVLWASPICTELSPAGGRKRRKQTRGQSELLAEGPVASEGFDRTRATFWDVIRATEVHRYTAVIIENVVEASEWELFDVWLTAMTTLGYNHQIVCVSSAHIGGPGNPYAPQWRDRLYIVFTRHGLPLPDVAPRPSAWCFDCGELVGAMQSWKRTDRPRIGKYGKQYVYVCPNEACRHRTVEPFVLPAAAAIDWSDLGTRIGDRKKPLAPATMRRIAAGLQMFAQPVTVAAAGNTYEAPGGRYVRAWPAHDAPLRARTCTSEDALACPPMLVPAGGTWNDDARPTDEPMRTRTTRDTEGLATAPFMVSCHSGGVERRVDPALETPLRTIERIEHMNKGVDEPMPSLVARPNVSLVIPYRRGRAKTTAEPLHTLATKDSAALVAPAIDVDDCHFRMLKPREHLRGQRFPDSYVVLGNLGEQTMQAGNAVSSNVAQFLGEAVAKVLG